MHMVSERFRRKQQPPTGRCVRGCCSPSNFAETIFTNNPYAPLLPPWFAKPFLVLVHALAAPYASNFGFRDLAHTLRAAGAEGEEDESDEEESYEEEGESTSMRGGSTAVHALTGAVSFGKEQTSIGWVNRVG